MAESQKDHDSIIRALSLLDPILQFLTRSTGQTAVPLELVKATLPAVKKIPISHLHTLIKYEIIQIYPSTLSNVQLEKFEAQWLGENETDQQDSSVRKFHIGFPNPEQSQSNKRLSGSTKSAAKRRLAELKRQLKNSNLAQKNSEQLDERKKSSDIDLNVGKDWTRSPSDQEPNNQEETPVLEIEEKGRKALNEMFGLNKTMTNNDTEEDTRIPNKILPKQMSYAGTHQEHKADYVNDIEGWNFSRQLDVSLLASLLGSHRRLYQHQAEAIESALAGIPTMVCTGTGSGKSLCFLVPVLQAALKGRRSMLLFPTKALAQDQLIKLSSLLSKLSLETKVKISTLDGDTPHSSRASICEQSHIILTNPDIIHATILPQWRKTYKPLFENLEYVVIDEAHVYTGVFGAHVTMVLARLYRISSLHCTTSSMSTQRNGVTFLACSATLYYPEHHFRLLCCIPRSKKVSIVSNDASPRAAKHFFVWNPPLLDLNGNSLGIVELPKRRAKEGKTKKRKKTQLMVTDEAQLHVSRHESITGHKNIDLPSPRHVLRRRHSADETALLLALAVTKGIRCIAFCKTRGLVEWVYERALAVLKETHGERFLSRVESYRGGYTKEERRNIEQKLFDNELLGVVGTSALELGVDIGGVDLTLHCGFPDSHASLLQQAGRSGRGAAASNRPSVAIVICFNSPVDQHLWRHPSSIFSRGNMNPLSMPIYPGLVQGHLLCAGQEFPLTGSMNVSSIYNPNSHITADYLSDFDLFGSEKVYQEALETLIIHGSVTKENLSHTNEEGKIIVYKTHPSIKNPWMKVSIRSMESVNYDIVDLSHPRQANRMDTIHDKAAVLDTIPYSRVFYHAFPGAIIMHRGRRYKIVSMTRPPAFGKGYRGTVTLGAFAKPSTHRYYTRPLSSLIITVVKQMERVDLDENSSRRVSSKRADIVPTMHINSDVSQLYSSNTSDVSCSLSFAGCGVVTVKRNVHGYKKLSMVTREEISRSELSLPDMEYDSFAFWLDCDANVLSSKMTAESFGHGVHALSHALVAVAPLFVPCVVSDVQCDHSIYNPTKICIFDARPGGSGICAQLWKYVFIDNGLVDAAMDLLDNCPSCSEDTHYEGGCPACIHVGECLKFNDFLCKSSGLIIARHLLSRLKQTKVYRDSRRIDSPRLEPSVGLTSPRRKARERAMRSAMSIPKANQRQVVVGRPSWPMDRNDGPAQE